MLKQQLKALATQRALSNSTSLVTLYVPGSTNPNDLVRMIRSELSKAPNIKIRQTRQGVQDALQAVLTNIKGLRQLPRNGVVIMTGQTTTHFESFIVEPPRPIDRFLYRCDTKFWV